MSDFARRVISRPMRLHWAGWETTTSRLQQAGWEVSAEQDFSRNTLRMAVRHPQWGAMGITDLAEYDFYREAYHSGPGQMSAPYDAHMRVRMGKEVNIHSMEVPGFQPIDAMPQIVHSRITRLGDVACFAPSTALTAPFVLPEEDVDQLLARILEKQQAAKTDYFRDLLAREGQILPRHKFHAQIISLPRAA